MERKIASMGMARVTRVTTAAPTISFPTPMASRDKVAAARAAKPIGCVGFRGNNRLLAITGVLVLMCYLMSELALRSWTPEDVDSQLVPDCLTLRGMSPSLPETPCRHGHLGVEVEKAPTTTTTTTIGPGRHRRSRATRRRIHPTLVSRRAVVDVDVERAAGNYEIDVDSSDFRPGQILRGRMGAHDNRESGRRRERTSPLINESLNGPSDRPQSISLVVGKTRGAMGAARPRGRQSTWTLWEGSKNGTRLEFVSADVLRYRHAMQEKGRSTVAPEMLALERKFYARNPKRVNPHEFRVLYNASGVCTDPPFLVMIIPSLPSSRERRNAIRDTWGSVARGQHWPNERLREKVRIAFLLGRTESFHVRMVVKQEAEQFGDIVQEDFLESYRNLSLKTVMGLKWVLNHCDRARYVMKCDDDMIAHIPMLLKMLREKRYQNAIIGHINQGAVVQRQGLWGLSPEEFPFDRFPPYASGTAYVMSGDLTRSLFQMSEHVPLVPIEDAYVTGVLGRMVGASLVHKDGFTSWNAFSPRTCDLILGRIFTGTKMTSNSLRRMWQRIKGGGPNCSRDAPNIVMARMSRNE